MSMSTLLSGLKKRLESPERGAGTLTVTLRDFLLVSYAVPAERVRGHVPDALALDLLPAGLDGTRKAVVQSTCFFNENLHWSPLRVGPGMSYYQSTYRVLTRRAAAADDQRRSAYFLRTYLGTPPSHAAQRAIAREADYAPFTVHVSGDPVSGRYDAYTMRAVGDRGQTALDVRGLASPPTDPSPFAQWDDLVFFLTQREDGYFDAATGGVGLMPVTHDRMTPTPAELVAARLTLWTELGILNPDELLRPLAVLIQPTIVFTTYPPRPAHLGD